MSFAGYVDTGLGLLHYRESGAGQPLILLHPAPRSSRVFARLMHAFERLGGIRAIAPDLPGFGNSCKLPPGTSINRIAETIAQFVEALGPKHARRALVRGRKHRRHGKMKARLKGDCLNYDSKATIQLFELAAHQGKPAVYWKFVGVIVGPEELSEGSLNERRLACARTFGGIFQPCCHLFR